MLRAFTFVTKRQFLLSKILYKYKDIKRDNFMPAPRIQPKISVNNANHISSDGALQIINTVRASVPLWKGANFSSDVGTSTTVSFSGGSPKTTLFLESKLNQKVADNLKTYLRYRKYGDTNQFRLGLGYSYPVNNKLSLYADGYYTTQFKKGQDSFGIFV